MSTGASTRAAAGFSLLSAALLAGCASVAREAASLDGTHWRVALINGRATPATDAYRMQFDEGRIGGRFGCNHFGGPYRIEGRVLVAGDVASTLIGCPEPSASFEMQGFTVLRQPMRMDWPVPQRLVLSNPAGSIALERLP